MNIFHADSWPFIHNVLIDLKTAQITGKRLQRWQVSFQTVSYTHLGLSGSPTKVKTIQNISFQAKESKTLTGSDRDVEDLIVELLEMCIRDSYCI